MIDVWVQAGCVVMSGSIGSMQVMRLPNAAVNSGFRQYLTGIEKLLSPLTGIHHVARRHGNPQDPNRHVTHGAHHNSFARADLIGATGAVRLTPLVPECLGDRLLAAVRPADGSLFPGQTLALHPNASS